MKIQIIDDAVHLVAENQSEALQLVKFGGSQESQEKPVRITRKHKKHKFYKPCDVCGKQFKVLKMHKTLMHSSNGLPIPTPSYA